MISDQELLAAMEMFEDDQQLVDALEAAETDRFATAGNVYYNARQQQREWQRNLIEQQGGQIIPDEPGRFKFDLHPMSRDVNRRYGIDERRYQVNLRQEGNLIDNIAPALRDGLQRAINQLLDHGNIPNTHGVYFDLFSECIRDGSYRANGLVAGDWRNNNSTVDRIFDHLQSALNSNESFQMDDTFRLEVITVAPRVVRGTGKARKAKINYLGIDDFLLKNKSIIKIHNPDDNLCAARAIVAAKAAADFPGSHAIRDRLTKRKKGTSDRPQLQAASKLTREAQVPEEVAVGPEELQKFQAVLPEYRLICIYTNRGNEAVAFSPYDPKKKPIVIVHINHHYHGCNTLTGFYQSSYMCDYCLKPYDQKGQHRCKAVENKMCKCCRRHDCPDFLRCHPQHLKASVPCASCGHKFFGTTCYDNHLKCDITGKVNPQNCICFNVRHCPQCGKLNSGKDSIQRHRCGCLICPTCKDYVDLDTHSCYIESAREVKRKRDEANQRRRAAKRRAQATEADEEEPTDIAEKLMEEDDFIAEPEPKRKQKKTPLHVWFDLEARQENGTHEANLCIYQTDEGCERVLHGEDCVKEFIKDLKNLTEHDTRKIIVIAHNLQAYDGYFVIKELYRDNKTVTQIRSGAKILEISHYDIRFIDSLNFFTMPLAAFLKTFGLKLYKKDEHGHFGTDQEGNYVEDLLAKGYFPHLFNRLENVDYVGPMPPKEDYMPNTMSLEDKKKFEEWYEQQVANQVVFDF